MYRNGNGARTKKAWSATVIARGVAILMRLVMPLINDKGDKDGKATKARIREIRHSGLDYVFVLEAADEADRRHLSGENRVNLSCLSLLFDATLRRFFPQDKQPGCVSVRLWDAETQSEEEPQMIWLENETVELEDKQEERTEE